MQLNVRWIYLDEVYKIGTLFAPLRDFRIILQMFCDFIRRVANIRRNPIQIAYFSLKFSPNFPGILGNPRYLAEVSVFPENSEIF